MRHNVDGRKFGRNTSHRVAMFRNLANSVIGNPKEQVVTTLPKAKEVRRVVDRLITLAKKGTPHHRRLAFDRTRDNRVVRKLFGPIAERFKKRAGGYTRVLKLSKRRRGDAAELAILELVDRPHAADKKVAKAAKKADAPAEQADPFNRYRKKFGGSKAKARAKVKEAQAASGDKKVKAKAAAKKKDEKPAKEAKEKKETAKKTTKKK